MSTQGFLPIVFPTGISYGITGGPTYSTSVITAASGAETRVQQWRGALGTWEAAFGIRTEDEFRLLTSFFRTVRGKAFTWMFRDWTDYTLDDELIGTGNGAQVAFHAIKIYGREWGVNLETKRVTKLDGPSVSVAVGGVPLDPTGFAVDAMTGIVSLAQPPAQGVPVTLTAEFYLVCRFDSDQMLGKLEDYNNLSWGQIPIKEMLT